ncbi:hypothetical protein AXX17_AT4G00650 [Arabidopsis thaliana]|uniref:Cyclic nucleotide-binding domain-containing protein n=1 Tax=Arabidopsis thaliana TaxID=3702 RepID=A0A178V1J4_ARATH|nr:hypothetical protein AXX17_AT4G00650 [Arabidopsis thaliana]
MIEFAGQRFDSLYTVMNTESVVEFLGNVTLLQRLPSSSLKRIAEVVLFKRYDRGDYVVRENQNVDGVYFLLQGQAQVLRSAKDENCQELPLKRYDFFGHGIFGDVYSADVVALSELTCLLLMSDHRALLEIKSVSDSEKERCLVEDILYLEPLDLNVFRGFTPPNAPTYGKVYGGQLVGQALAAASKTVETMKIVHNFHSYFLLVGDINSKGIVLMCFCKQAIAFPPTLKPCLLFSPDFSRAHASVTLCKLP